MPRQHKAPPIHSLSHGTMQPEDLIPPFLLELFYRNKRHAGKVRKEYKGVLHTLNCDQLNCRSKYHLSDQEQDKQAGYLVETLFDALNEYALPYMYCGAHPGDGSDYGYWLSDDSLHDAIESGEVYKIDAGNRWPTKAESDAIYILEVTNRGSTTLYNRRSHKEIWSLRNQSRNRLSTACLSGRGSRASFLYPLLSLSSGQNNRHHSQRA